MTQQRRGSVTGLSVQFRRDFDTDSLAPNRQDHPPAWSRQVLDVRLGGDHNGRCWWLKRLPVAAVLGFPTVDKRPWFGALTQGEPPMRVSRGLSVVVWGAIAGASLSLPLPASAQVTEGVLHMTQVT
jgi:hypothetical protein